MLCSQKDRYRYLHKSLWTISATKRGKTKKKKREELISSIELFDFFRKRRTGAHNFHAVHQGNLNLPLKTGPQTLLPFYQRKVPVSVGCPPFPYFNPNFWISGGSRSRAIQELTAYPFLLDHKCWQPFALLKLYMYFLF